MAYILVVTRGADALSISIESTFYIAGIRPLLGSSFYLCRQNSDVRERVIANVIAEQVGREGKGRQREKRCAAKQ